MAQDVVDQAIVLGALEARECVTRHFSIHGFHRYPSRFGKLAFYGSDAQLIEKLKEDDESMAAPLHSGLPIIGAEVQWACRNEMARTVDDILARRTRCLLFDARAAIEVAPRVAAIMAAELGRDQPWIERQVADFEAIAAIYVYQA